MALVELESLGDADLGGVACYRLRGAYAAPVVDPAGAEMQGEEDIRLAERAAERAEHSPTTLWIDRGTLLIRRIEEGSRFETFSTEQVTEYAPAVEVEIGAAELAFDPPA